MTPDRIYCKTCEPESDGWRWYLEKFSPQACMKDSVCAFNWESVDPKYRHLSEAAWQKFLIEGADYKINPGRPFSDYPPYSD